MRTSLAMIFVMSLLLLDFCGKKENAGEPGAPAGKTDQATINKTDRAANAVMNGNEPAGEIPAASSVQFALKECTYSPENPTAFDDVTITPFLNEGFSNDESILKDVTFEYRWIVQNKEIADVKGNKLEKKYFKKKDWIQCRVRGFLKSQKTPEFRAKVISIQNSPPVLNLQPTDEFAVPGEFTYQITASDPDNDPLTYSLIAPLDLGININTETGLIVWPINEDLAKKSPANEIKFAVSDNDGGKAEGSIIINFLTKEIEKK